MQVRIGNYLLIGALFCGLIGVTIHQTDEISAADYRVLRNDFKQGTPNYRAAIAAAMHSGEVNRWEYRNLRDRYQNETGVSPVESIALNLREERLVLAAMTRQLNNP